MGISDPYINSFYCHYIKPQGETALLGFTHNWCDGDLYDLQLGNWNINDDWKLEKKYDTIISLRCPYFAKDPEMFIKKCHENLNEGGKLYIDWGLGDHWRFKNFKVGWTKDGEHEYAYEDDNFLWSTVWDESFLSDPQYQKFEQSINYPIGVKEAIFNEVPSVLLLSDIKKYFNLKYNLLYLCLTHKPQLYILVSGEKIS
jgi:SAM-dependent methyltransferase